MQSRICLGKKNHNSLIPSLLSQNSNSFIISQQLVRKVLSGTPSLASMNTKTACFIQKSANTMMLVSMTLLCPSRQFVCSTNLRILQDKEQKAGANYLLFTQFRETSHMPNRRRERAGESLLDDFIIIMIKDAEKPRTE